MFTTQSAAPVPAPLTAPLPEEFGVLGFHLCRCDGTASGFREWFAVLSPNPSPVRVWCWLYIGLFVFFTFSTLQKLHPILVYWLSSSHVPRPSAGILRSRMRSGSVHFQPLGGVTGGGLELCAVSSAGYCVAAQTKPRRLPRLPFTAQACRSWNFEEYLNFWEEVTLSREENVQAILLVYLNHIFISNGNKIWRCQNCFCEISFCWVHRTFSKNL